MRTFLAVLALMMGTCGCHSEVNAKDWIVPVPDVPNTCHAPEHYRGCSAVIVPSPRTGDWIVIYAYTEAK